MKRGKRLEINFTNKWLYVFIIVVVIVVIAVGIYAVTPGTAPNPGHLLSDISPPAGCTTGQFVQFNGSDWVCTTVAVPTALYGMDILTWFVPDCPGRPLVCPSGYYSCTSSSVQKEPAYCNNGACACRTGYTSIQLGPGACSCSKN